MIDLRLAGNVIPITWYKFILTIKALHDKKRLEIEKIIQRQREKEKQIKERHEKAEERRKAEISVRKILGDAIPDDNIGFIRSLENLGLGFVGKKLA